MLRNLPAERHFKVYCGNWFSSVPLVNVLISEKRWVVATSQKNRLGGRVLEKDNALRGSGRGSFDYQSDEISGIRFAK